MWKRWMDWQQTTFNPAGRDAFVQLIRQPGGRADADKVAASVAATEPLLDLLDQHLATHRFIAGDHYTVADIPLACEMHRWTGLPLSLRPRPHLDAWVWRRARTACGQGHPGPHLDLTLRHCHDDFAPL
jgi:glutathione S-transferase